ncbi:MAG: hypothetical protein ACR2MD_02760 [Aridibacter sp.]
MTLAKITFKSNNHNLEVFGNDQADCETLLKNYLGEYHGGLEISERSNADEYFFSKNSKGKQRGIREIHTATDWQYGEYILGEKFHSAE